jgi:hypothetical protein
MKNGKKQEQYEKLPISDDFYSSQNRVLPNGLPERKNYPILSHATPGGARSTFFKCLKIFLISEVS